MEVAAGIRGAGIKGIKLYDYNCSGIGLPWGPKEK